MMKALNLRLTACCFIGLFLFSLGGNHIVFAQNPVADVESEQLSTTPTLSEDRNIPVVMELFSSQSCVFCPRADRLFGDLLQQPHIIGLNCQVDFFDVKEGSLSKPFCTARQADYMGTLNAGPVYTPQMVLQGQIDVVGYKMDDITEALKKAVTVAPLPLQIVPAEKSGEYMVSPAPDALWENKIIESGEHTILWLALYDKPHDLIIAEGTNKGKNMVYYNVVSALQEIGSWNAEQQETIVTPTITAIHAGFAVIVQDTRNGHILAAGQYETVMQNESVPN